MRRIVVCLFVVGVVAVFSGARASAAPAALSAVQKRIADALISEFEFSRPLPQYCDFEALGDGRGYTVGRAGFTTATGDLLEVVEIYDQLEAGNPLEPFLPRLEQLATAASGETSGLDGFRAAWREACTDPLDRRAQDQVSDRDYYEPAVALWRELGLRTPLALAVLYDTMVQHGGGSDPDGAPALVERTLAGVGSVRRAGERRWLLAFLAVRRQDLLHPHDQTTQIEWAQSVDRVDVWVYLVETKQWQLRAPVRVDTADYQLNLR